MTRSVLAVLIAATVLMAGVPVAGAQSQSDPAAVMQQFIAAINRNDRSAAIAMFSDQAIVIGGPCSGPPSGGECVGRAQIDQAILQSDPVQVNLSNLQVVGNGNVVTFRADEHFPLPPEAVAAGVHRQVEFGTAVISGGKIDRLALVADVTDPQTVTLHHIFGTLGPPPSANTTSDGQSLATQSATTQALFRAAYGDQAAMQWANQHQAALSR